jgi:hypothetical protein
MPRWRAGNATVAVMLLWAAAARAGGGPATDAYHGVEGGHCEAHFVVDLYLQHRFVPEGDGPVRLRAFDPVNGPAVGLLRLVLARKPKTFGWRIDLGVGDLADAYWLSDPLATTQPDVARWLSRVQQAFVSAVLPLGRGLRVDAGKFETPIGLEDNEAFTNWSYSRSLLFNFAEPSVHSGVRATYAWKRAWALSLFWLDGWNASFGGGDGMRAYAVAARFERRDRVEVVLVYAGGLERQPRRLFDPALSFRNLVDFYVRYVPARRVTLALTADYGHDQARGGVDFGGAAGYVSVEAARWLRATVRGEVFADPQGFTTGLAQTVGEATLTLDAHASLHRLRWSLRLEYRHDQSTARPFGDGASRSASQDTITAALLAGR